jgi:hypothetical protein
MRSAEKAEPYFEKNIFRATTNKKILKVFLRTFSGILTASLEEK